MTVEKAIETAIFESELIAEHNYGKWIKSSTSNKPDNLKKIKWSRAARTDKGVHAVANYVSCKLSITENFLDDELERK